MAKRKETVPEALVREELTLRQIEFVQEHPIRIGNRKWCYYLDFLLPWTNTVIEVDGEYWHSLEGQQKIDNRKDKRLKELGYKVIRLTEQEIMEDIEKAVDRVLKEI